MLEETYQKFKKHILPKMKKNQPELQEPRVEHCESQQIIDICSYNHYPVLDKATEKITTDNADNDIYDTTELEHEFEYGIYEDIVKTEEFMAELNRIDQAEYEQKKIRDIEFDNFPLEQFADAGKVANQGDPHLKAAADNELYELEQRAIQMESHELTSDENETEYIKNDKYENTPTVSHVHEKDKQQKSCDDKENTMRKIIYGPTYVPFKEDGQKILLPQSTDMSRKDNLKHLYSAHPEGTSDIHSYSLEQDVLDTETFSYSHKPDTKQVLVQGVYIGSASPLIADIKTKPYSVISYSEYGTLTGTYDNTHEIPIYVDNRTTLNIMPTHFYEKAYYLHHLPKEVDTINTIHTGNGPIQTCFWIDILLNIQGCMLQFKLLVCDTKAQTGILLSKMALEQLQTWQDYTTNSLYIKQTAIDLYATQDVELFPERKTTLQVIADRTNKLQYKNTLEGLGIVWVWCNDSSKPLQPIVGMFHDDKTLITFENTTGQTQYISKGAKVAILDMRSKDGGMTNFEWDIPTDDEGNLVLYTHTPLPVH